MKTKKDIQEKTKKEVQKKNLAMFDYKTILDDTLLNLDKGKVDCLTARTKVLVINGVLNIVKTALTMQKNIGDKVSPDDIRRLFTSKEIKVKK